MKKQKTVILDSSVWISFLYKKDINHAKACKIMKEVKDYTIVLPEIILSETIINLYKVNKSLHETEKIMNFLLDNLINLVTLNLKIKFKLILKYLISISLKASDFQILLYVMHYNPDIFYSFDKKLKREYIKLAGNHH